MAAVKALKGKPYAVNPHIRFDDYDKIYKNFGFGDGIFSWNRWCRRQQQKEAK